MEDLILNNIRTSIRLQIQSTSRKIDKLVNIMLNDSAYKNLILKNHEKTEKSTSNK